jgi:hypothetical protein
MLLVSLSGKRFSKKAVLSPGGKLSCRQGSDSDIGLPFIPIHSGAYLNDILPFGCLDIVPTFS